MTAKASITAYSTPTVANLNPATSLLVVNLSKSTRRRTTTGPSIAMSVGKTITRTADSHNGSKVRNIGLSSLERVAEQYSLQSSAKTPPRQFNAAVTAS